MYNIINLKITLHYAYALPKSKKLHSFRNAAFYFCVTELFYKLRIDIIHKLHHLRFLFHEWRQPFY